MTEVTSQGSGDPGRLRRLLGGPETAWLVQRVRRRMERGLPLTGRLVLDDPEPAQRAAVELLLGSRPRAGSRLSVDLATVDAVLRHSGACPAGLAAAIVVLGGEVTDRAAEAARVEAAWSQAFAALEDDPRPELESWRTVLRSSGLVRRLCGSPAVAQQVLADAARVLAALPAQDEPRGRLAARVLGHAHALDDGKLLATIVFGAARALGGVLEGTGAGWRRQVWEAAGVLRDDLSSTVLLLGFPGDPSSPLGRVIREWQAAGEPVTLSLRQLRSAELAMALGTAAVAEVFVCENPVVVSMAADRWGAQCAPLVCVNGQPGAAVHRVLETLAAAGIRRRYHGDFDWGGVRIANGVMARFGLTPWHLDAGAYLDAAAHGLGRELTGHPVAASWDPALSQAMIQTGLGIDEEHVVDDLLNDLGARGGRI